MPIQHILQLSWSRDAQNETMSAFHPRNDGLASNTFLSTQLRGSAVPCQHVTLLAADSRHGHS